jgi:acetate kinase
VLTKYFPENIANGKIAVAHLGNGASACALNNKQSVASSMGFTALEGLMMGTRCGNIDPGVVLYLLEEKKLTIKETINFLYKESGLLGVSGISSDVRELEASSDPNAKYALELFCYRAARELLALCTILKGLDLIVFTAGIGEHSSFIRQQVCAWLSWLGISIDENANKSNANIISDKNSKITVAVIPTNEELMIVEHTIKIIG